MHKTFSQKNQTAYSVRIVCGLLFILFCAIFLYLKNSQLEALQHLLSEGKTSYSPIWGTAIITLILCILQVIVSYLTRFVDYVHALSYFPSILILAFITDKDRNMYQSEHMENWGWIFLGSIFIYAILIWINRKWLPHFINKANFPNLASRLWPNILIFILLSVTTLCLSPINIPFLCETKMESLIRQGHYSEASKIGKKNFITSRELTALRAYTLSRTDTLGSCLFEYLQPYGSDGLLLNPKTQTTSMKAEELYSYLGTSPQTGETNLHYFSRICHTETGNHPALDYYLCALLLEKKLNSFAKELHNFYEINELLPKHYKEALILYRHRHGEYEMPFDATKMEQEYQQFLTNRNDYRNTYWWYYFNY